MVVKLLRSDDTIGGVAVVARALPAEARRSLMRSSRERQRKTLDLLFAVAGEDY